MSDSCLPNLHCSTGLKDPLRGVFTGRFEQKRRLDEIEAATPKSGISGLEQTFAGEEILYKFFAPELQQHFPTSVNDQALFIRILHAEGIDTGLGKHLICV